MTDSILDLLERGRVVSFEQSGEKIIVMECCDDHFEQILTKPQFAKFISELQEIHDRMEPHGNESRSPG